MKRIPAHLRTPLVFSFDLLAVVLAWFGAYYLRFNLELERAWAHAGAQLLWTLIPLLVAQYFACRLAGLYRGMWCFASLPDMRRVLKAVVLSALTLLAIAFFVHMDPAIPRSVVVLYPILLLLLMAGGRLFWRMMREEQLLPSKMQRKKGLPVVIVGAGSAGMMLMRELMRTNEWNVVALVDDNPHKKGLELHGCRVEGGIDDLPEILQAHKAKHVILAIPSASTRALQRATKIATQVGASTFTVPGLAELMSGRVAINAMRPVKIEDLLGREAVYIDTDNVQQMLAGKRLLVTGAGGSIGAELCKQLSRFSPRQIILVESSEYALYMIDSWFREKAPRVDVAPLTGDVKDKTRMREIFERWKPQIIFHAAAYKHVPLMEVNNAWQALRNNVLGTYTVASEALRIGAERFVLIPTDKAVNPTNVMGTTKRMAEMTCQALQHQSRKTRFQMVRFGNVLGSTGSVIPKFREQIAAGGPETVTHPEVTRYFMSIPEAAQLVLQAASMGAGGEIFVLDMGEPIQILTLAKNMIRLAGYTEDQIEITFTGLRPGEKMYEELLADAEQTVQTPHPKLRIARARPADAALIREAEYWLDEQLTYSDEQVRALLKQWVTEYAPSVLPLDDERAGSTKAIRSADVEVEGAVRP